MKTQKIKYLIIGIIFGLMLNSTITLASTTKSFILTLTNYPIVVDGNVYENEELPILNYNGSTYVPLREMGNLLDAKIKWNTNQVEIEKSNLIHEDKSYGNLLSGRELLILLESNYPNSKINLSLNGNLTIDDQDYTIQTKVINSQTYYDISTLIDENIL